MKQNLQFPLALSLLTLLATSVALMLAVFGIHWGALARPEVLNLSAPYVFQALLAVVFLIWPALQINRRVPLTQYILDGFTIIVSAAPACIFGWWLSEYSWQSAGGTVMLLVGFIVVAMALLALTSLMSQPVQMAGHTLLLFWYLGGLMATYLHAEFAPSLADYWLNFVPIIAICKPAALKSAFLTLSILGAIAFVFMIAMFYANRRLSAQRQSISAQPI